MTIKIKFMTVFCALFFVITTSYSKSIEWITPYDEAFKKAKIESRNLLVLITAPTWRGWCKKFDVR